MGLFLTIIILLIMFIAERIDRSKLFGCFMAVVILASIIIATIWLFDNLTYAIKIRYNYLPCLIIMAVTVLCSAIISFRDRWTFAAFWQLFLLSGTAHIILCRDMIKPDYLKDKDELYFRISTAYFSRPVLILMGVIIFMPLGLIFKNIINKRKKKQHQKDKSHVHKIKNET